MDDGSGRSVRNEEKRIAYTRRNVWSRAEIFRRYSIHQEFLL